MKKQKVAHLTSVHTASDTRIAYRECATLAEAGYEVVLIAAGPAPPLPRGVRYRSVPLPRNRAVRMIRTVWQIYRIALSERADIYHFHDPELMGIGLLLRMRGARVIFDVHEDIPKDIIDKSWIPFALRWAAASASRMVLRAVQRWYSAIVAATPAIAQAFSHRHLAVVCNYPRVDELPTSQSHDFSKRPRNVVYLGSITELRCIQEVVSAMVSPELGAGIRLLLAGTFETIGLERKVSAMLGWSRVEYLGQCERKRLPDVLAGARAGILLFRPAANHTDALPNKLFEYLGSGLPVIISNSLRCSDIVNEYGCGIVVDAGSVETIASAMTFLVDHPEIAQEMGERGRRLVKERYQWTTEAEKLTKLYAEIA